MHLIPALLTILACLLSVLTRAASAQGAATPELPTLKSDSPLALRSVTPNALSVGRLEKLELTLDLSATYDNPFDPEQTQVRCLFTAPSGRTVPVNGFFYQPYTIRGGEDDAKTPLLDEAAEPRWEVRFAPTETGTYTYQVTVRDRSGEAKAEPGAFEVVESQRAGFVRVSRQNPRYFAYDNGAPFFPGGQNLQNH